MQETRTINKSYWRVKDKKVDSFTGAILADKGKAKGLYKNFKMSSLGLKALIFSCGYDIVSLSEWDRCSESKLNRK